MSCISCLSNRHSDARPSKCSMYMYYAIFSQGYIDSVRPLVRDLRQLKEAGPVRMRPAMHLYITQTLYFEIYTMLLEVIQLMSIAEYEAYVCVCFFAYKPLQYVQPFIRLPWDTHSRPCLSILRGIFYLLQKCTGTRTKNILKKEQKVGMLLQKRADTRGVGISSMSKSIYSTSLQPHPLATPIHSTYSPQLSSIRFNLCKVKSMDDNCGVGGMYGCG